MDEMDELRTPEFIAKAKEINRLRELDFRGTEVGIELSDETDLDSEAARLSTVIDEVRTNRDDLNAWQASYCESMPTDGYVNGVIACCVLGDKFGLDCRNDKGEKCRYASEYQ